MTMSVEEHQNILSYSRAFPSQKHLGTCGFHEDCPPGANDLQLLVRQILRLLVASGVVVKVRFGDEPLVVMDVID